MLHLIERVFFALRTRFSRDEGQTLVEYALIIGLVSLGLIGALNLLAVDLTEFFARVGAALDDAVS